MGQEEDGEISIIVISDTHSMHDQLDVLQLADIFIHAGDFTMNSQPQQLQDFRIFVQNLPHQHKIIIPGNHEHIFNPDSTKMPYNKEAAEEQKQKFKQICHFLEFQMVEVKGLYILGISKGADYFDWNFDFVKEQGRPIIQKYKGKVDILITHWPPYGILDSINKKQKGGSKGLLQFVEAIKPKIHIFGHIHEGYGELSSKNINFINASSSNQYYELKNQPIILKINQTLNNKKIKIKQV